MIENVQERWHDLGIFSERLKKEVFDIGIDEVWVFCEKGVLKAVSNICPHKMGPVSRGMLKDSIIECPWHGYRFDIKSGSCISHKCFYLRRYETKVENGCLFVKEVTQ